MSTTRRLTAGLLVGVACAAAAATTSIEPVLTAASSCEAVASMAFPDAKITAANPVEAGAFSPPGAPNAQQTTAFKQLPAFCRVAATLKPSSDSDIKIELWLPASNWNGKFQAVGNGGWAGSINYAAMAEALLVSEGAHCICLGMQTPIDDIRLATLAFRIQIVALTFSASFPPRPAAEALASLRRELPGNVDLWAGGPAARRMSAVPGARGDPGRRRARGDRRHVGRRGG